MEPFELPSPARERDHSGSGRKVEYYVAERGLVAQAFRV